MFERFTDRARKVMALANRQALRYKHEYIGTEHILLGLVEEGTGVGAQVLKNLGLDLERVSIEVAKLVQSGTGEVLDAKLPLTRRGKRVIEYAVEESRMFGHNYVGTEHLLLGLLREEGGVAAQVLVNLGLDLERVRVEVLKLLGAGVETEAFPDAASQRPPPGEPGHAPAYEELLKTDTAAGLLRVLITELVARKDQAVTSNDHERAGEYRAVLEDARLLLGRLVLLIGRRPK